MGGASGPVGGSELGIETGVAIGAGVGAGMGVEIGIGGGAPCARASADAAMVRAAPASVATMSLFVMHRFYPKRALPIVCAPRRDKSDRAVDGLRCEADVRGWIELVDDGQTRRGAGDRGAATQFLD
jgi:hypothetical protein